MSTTLDPTTAPTKPRSARWADEAVASPEATRPQQMAKVFGYIKGFHAVHVMDLGTRMGLFAALTASPAGMTPDSLAQQTGMQASYLRQWCETACALELLDYDPESGYRLAPYMDELLGQAGGTYYLGGFPRLHVVMSRDYERYPGLFASGGVYSYQDHDRAFLTSVAETLQTLPRMFIDGVLPRLPSLQAKLEAGATVLDVGCGGGYAMVELAERFPTVRCVGLDVEPTSIQLAHELIRTRGLQDRISAHLVEGTTWPSDWAGQFDLVTTFLVLHEIHPSLKTAVLAHCADVLKPGGQLLLFDERYPSGPTELRDATQIVTVMAQWYELTWGNVINTREEIHALLAQAGLRVADETALSRFYIVTAEKQ